MVARGRNLVAPFVGAWIEIGILAKGFYKELVAPFVGAWIEMMIAKLL